MADPIVSVRNVSRRYPGGVTAVDNVSVDIMPNEFFALLGPSGCGKTTLLRMISGLDTPSEGQIFIGGYFYDPFYGPYPWWNRVTYPYWYLPAFDLQADVRIQVTPKELRDTAVYVDGFYAGVVDDFDGVFQALPCESLDQPGQMRGQRAPMPYTARVKRF